MRLDKWLKVSRLIKRRTVAKELCDAGRVSVNGRPAKAGTEIKVGDILSLSFGTKVTEVKVLILAENMRVELCPTMYELLK